MNNNEVVLLNLPAKHYIGIPVTVAFQQIDSSRIQAAYEALLERKDEIQGKVSENEYVCPHYANDVLFTYIYSMEVAELRSIPDGMIGFSIPSQSYAKVRSADREPYEVIKEFLSTNGLENNTRSLALEVFRFGEEQHYNNADILVPIK